MGERASRPLAHRAASRSGRPRALARLGEADWLDGGFSAGDLMTATMLLRLKGEGLLDEFANLAAYLARAEARPAYARAFAAQRAVFMAADG